MTKNRQATKAMAAIENRLSDKRTAVITRDEFEAIVDYIEEIEERSSKLACDLHSCWSQQWQPEEYVYGVDRASGEDYTSIKTSDKCPGCGGFPDNGYDRSWPKPQPYYCTKCDLTLEDYE